MNQTKIKIAKISFIAVVGIMSVLLFLILQPVPIPTEESCIVETGVVTAVFEGAEKDVILKLNNTNRRFYINRGLENGLELTNLSQKLVNNEVTIKYADYWTPLDPNHTIKHIAKLEVGNEVIFNEMN